MMETYFCSRGHMFPVQFNFTFTRITRQIIYVFMMFFMSL